MSWFKNLFKAGPPEPPPPPPPAMELTYKFTADGRELLVEIPGLTQTAGKPQGSRHNVYAENSYDSAYLFVSLVTGRIGRKYSTPGIPLEDVPRTGKVVGWTFMLGAIELVNANQFENHHYPPTWVGFNAMWDIASMMENGERALFTRNFNPHDVMLKFTNQVRMLLAPIQTAQRAKRADHVALYKLLKAEDTGPKQEELRAKLVKHYAETFKPPELLF